MVPPPRSQSFRHRARPMTLGAALTTIVATDLRHPTVEALGGERRRSTPTINRRSSLQHKARTLDTIRTDVWPEPKQMSEIEERFLKLPDFEDYTRVRQFKIDAKGAVVSRGDSFRRKHHANISQSNSCTFDTSKNESFISPFPTNEKDSTHRITNYKPSIITAALSGSRSTSVSSSESGVVAHKVAKSNLLGNTNDGSASLQTEDGSLIVEETPSTSHASYKVYVIGQNGSGKTSLIKQFTSSEYRNAFADDIEEICNATTVSVDIGGFECDLNFFEADPNMNIYWEEQTVSAYVLLYSIDRKSSFRTVIDILEAIRAKQKLIPIILAGNKIDLERKRAISAHEVKCVMLTYDVVHFEISVALNHDIDDLLVGIVAQIKESVNMQQRNDVLTTFNHKNRAKYNNENNILVNYGSDNKSLEEPAEFRAAIRRFSQRKKRQMGACNVALDSTKCTNLNPIGLFEKFRQWRRGISKC